MDEAVFAFRKVLEVNPKSAQAYNSLGTVLAAQDKTADAISAFRKAVDENPNILHGAGPAREDASYSREVSGEQ